MTPRDVVLAWVAAFNDRDAIAAADLYWMMPSTIRCQRERRRLASRICWKVLPLFSAHFPTITHVH